MVERKIRLAPTASKSSKTTSPKLFVLDTNVLMHDPTSLFRFEEHDVYLPILTLEEDNTAGIHDMLIAACDPARYEGLGVEGWHASCEENLHHALEALGVEPIPRFAPQPINLFMNTPARADGTIEWLPAETKAGEHVVLRAELNILVAVSACPQDIVAINQRRPSPIEIELL